LFRLANFQKLEGLWRWQIKIELTAEAHYMIAIFLSLLFLKHIVMILTTCNLWWKSCYIVRWKI